MAEFSVLTSDNLVGVVQDISDEITDISPTNTPFLTMAGNGEKALQTIVQWMEDALDAPAQNAAIEGAPAPAAAMTQPTMRQNITQILTKTVEVTGTTDATKLHGRGKEFARQLAKKGKEIKRDLEYSLVGTRQVYTPDSGGSAARLMAGAQAQIDVSMVVSAGNTVLSETMLCDAAQLSYNVGAEPSKLLISSAFATAIADFAGSNGRYRDLKDIKKVVNAVDVYVTPYGIDLTVVIDRWIQPNDALVMDPSMWKMHWLRPWQTKALAITGDSHSSQLLGEVTLGHRNFVADALITDLNVPTPGSNTAGTTAATAAAGSNAGP